MIIGSGFIAKAFTIYQGDDSIVIFASGVSNSQCCDTQEFQREKELIESTILRYPEQLFVYFSTCSVTDTTLQSSLYVQHKMRMESYISKISQHFLIVRISNPIGNTSNPYTIVNYIYNKIVKQESFVIWAHAMRNLIDITDLVIMVQYAIDQKSWKNTVISIANPQYFSMLDLVTTLERIVGIAARYTLEEKGGTPTIPRKHTDMVIEALQMNFDNTYLRGTLEKYYTKAI